MRALTAMGHRPVAASLLRIRIRPVVALPDTVQAVLVTSGQAVFALQEQRGRLRDCRVLAVGDSTARHARAAGFTQVESASGDATRLATLAATRLRPQDGPLLLLSGAGQGLDLAGQLRQAGFRVVRRCVYEANPLARLPDEALKILQEQDVAAILFFSGETSTAFVRALPPRLQPTLAAVRALAISARAAEPLRSLSWRSIEAAPTPDAASLLSLLGPA